MKEVVWKWLKFLAFNPVLFFSALITLGGVGVGVFALGICVLAAGDLAMQFVSGAIGWSAAWSGLRELFPVFALSLFFGLIGYGSSKGLLEGLSEARGYASDAINESQRVWSEHVERQEAQDAQGGMLSMSVPGEERGGLSPASAPQGSLDAASSVDDDMVHAGEEVEEVAEQA